MEYYKKYEERYQAVYAAGADLWGFAPDSQELIDVLTAWVQEHNLAGKRIIEFACGEGAAHRATIYAHKFNPEKV